MAAVPVLIITGLAVTVGAAVALALERLLVIGWPLRGVSNNSRNRTKILIQQQMKWTFYSVKVQE